MEREKQIRERMAAHLDGGEAFMPLESFLDGIPFKRLGDRPAGLPYSFYELFYHLVFTQRDILDFTAGEVYNQPKWPEDYWPPQQAPAQEQEWEDLKELYFRDREKIGELVLDLQRDLLDTAKHGNNQTLLREVLLVMEHTAYHTGQLMLILRLLGLYSNKTKT